LFVGACVDKGHVMIVTEYCFGGSLFSLLHEKRGSIKITPRQKYTMALDIAKGLNFLHTQEPNPVLHRDLKSLNLLVSEPVKEPDDYVQIKITNFGLSRDLLDGDESFDSRRMTELAGTFHWMAPEVLRSDEYTHKADVYSYRICLWEILCLEPPFKSWKPHEIITKVV
jgi:mitogen-activated protein kinase kinase kinase 10